MSKEEKKIVPELRFPEFKNKEGWEYTVLSEVATFSKGKNVSKKDIVTDGKLFCIRYGELYTQYNEVVDEVISKTNLPKEELVLSKKNDVIIPSSGETRIDIARASCVLNEGIALGGDLNIIRSKINGVFLSYYLNSTKKETIAKMAQGVSVMHLYNSQLEKLKIEIPKPKEQQKIANCLSSLDDVITAETKKLDLLREHKKGLLQQLFPKQGETKPQYRFPKFENQKEWKDVKLISVTNKSKKWSFTGGPFGSNLKSSDYVEEKEGVRIIQLQNIGDGEFKDDYKIYTSKEKADELLSCNIYPGDIIMSKMGDPVGRACLIPEYHNRYVMSSDGIRIAVDENKYDKYFIYLVINSKIFRSKVENSSTGSTRKRIGLVDLKKLTLTIPKDKDEQQKIANCLSSADDLIEAQKIRIKTLKKHKKGLMQQLFPNVNSL